MAQASEIKSFTSHNDETAIDVWAWSLDSSALVFIAISCLSWLLSKTVFGPYSPFLLTPLLFAQCIWNWLAYLLLGVGKGFLLRSYLQHRRTTRDRLGRGDEGVEAPNESSGLLVDS